MKTINKPWGKEVWIELNDKYCFKEIHLKKDKRTSFQYHEKKLETSYVLSGKIEVLLENDSGEIQTYTFLSGDSFTIRPPRKHRVTALEDSVYLEASTPEVDDVVRIQDDYLRKDGRIDSEHKA